MDDYPEEFFFVGFLKQFGITPDGVQRDDQIAVDEIPFVVVEGDDICVVVVPKIFVVHLKDLLIVHEEITDLTDTLSLGCCHRLDPCGSLKSLAFRHLDAFCLECNHLVMF